MTEHATPIVAVGGSAGGLDAFIKLLKHLPADTGMAFVFLQHLDPARESMLAHLLSTSSSMPVCQLKDALPPLPNTVYVAPPALRPTYTEGAFRLSPRPIDDAPSTLIDGFMQSLANELGERCVGVVLSGNGSDGLAGLAAIRLAGGATFCQTPASARNDEMPLAAMAAGVVDAVLELESLGLALARVGTTLQERGELPPSQTIQPQDPTPEQRALAQLLDTVRAATGVDFAEYKPATVLRRIERRMKLSGDLELASYLERVSKDEREAAKLHAELLIGVTSFFRDPSAFSALSEKALEPLVKARAGALRIWVAGCSTGQEPYSLAICALESVEKHGQPRQIQIFATDVRETALERARAGIYPQSIKRELSAKRLARFFVEHPDGYRVSKEVRELCVFAAHDVVRDPAFSRLDLISCRNLLIYLGAESQKKVIAKFHHALLPDGMLMLGRSESIGDRSVPFERVDHQQRIYRRCAALNGLNARLQVQTFVSSRAAANKPSIVGVMGYDVRKEADRVLLGRFVSAAILVDPQLQVIQFRGETGPYMGPLSGAASLNVLSLVDEALLPILRHGIATVQKTRRTFRKRGLMATLQGNARELNVEILPLCAPETVEVSCLIVLSKAQRGQSALGEPPLAVPGKGQSARMIEQLTEELAMTREHLRASVAEQESSNESLRAALEELQSTNEELQVSNEELETGKEELQNTNEELTTANDQVHMRNAELSQLIHDHVAVVETAGVASLLFGRDLRLRRISPLAATLTRLTSADIGRLPAELSIALAGCDLGSALEQVAEGSDTRHLEAHDGSGLHYVLALRPYLSTEGVLEGVVVTLSDVTALRVAEGALASAELRIQLLEGLPATKNQ